MQRSYLHAYYRVRVLGANRIPFQTPRPRHVFFIRGQDEEYFSRRLFTFDSATAAVIYHSFSNIEGYYAGSMAYGDELMITLQ